MGGHAISLARGRLFKLCEAGLDATTFRRELRACLARLVPFDAYCVNTVDPDSLVITSSIGDGLSPVHARQLFDIEVRGTDFNALARLTAPVTMHGATGGDVSRSERMRTIFVPLGYRDELRAALSIEGRCWGYLHLFRARPFDAAELAEIAKVTVPIARALRSAWTLSGAASSAFGVVLVDETITVSKDASCWVDDLGEDVGGRVPHAIVHAGACAPVFARINARLAVRAGRIGSRAVVVLEPSRPADVRGLRFEAHGLTAREREVAELLVEGASNAAIAARLEITHYTAKDHVKSVFAKTNTEGRASFQARFT